MKRVVFLTNALALGGAEKVFIEESSELQRRGYDVHMVLLFRLGERAKDTNSPVPVQVIGMRSVFDVRGFVRALRMVRNLKPDVLYTTLNEANFVGRLIACMLPRATLLTRESNTADSKPLLYKLGDIFFGLRSSTIIAVSDAVGRSVTAYAPHLASRIRTLYNATAVLPDTASTGSDSAHESVRLLTVGSLTEKKDHAVLVKAMKYLPPQITLTIAGGGSLRKELEALAYAEEVADRIVFTGLLQPERVAELYRSHDLFVLPSKREGCPNVVLEALSYQLPVVAFDIPGMSEFVQPQWGIVVSTRNPKEFAAAIEKLITSPVEVRRKMGHAGAAHIAGEHTMHTHIEKLMQLFSY